MAPGLFFGRSGHSTIKVPERKQQQTASTEQNSFNGLMQMDHGGAKKETTCDTDKEKERERKKPSFDIASSSVMF